jgi:hypothetical protein
MATFSFSGKWRSHKHEALNRKTNYLTSFLVRPIRKSGMMGNIGERKKLGEICSSHVMRLEDIKGQGRGEGIGGKSAPVT